MKEIDRIRSILKDHKPVLEQRFKVKEIAIFGSYVREKEKEGSDIDILVDFSGPVGFFAFLDLEEYLQDLLKTKVDLVSKKALKPRIGKNILKEMILI